MRYGAVVGLVACGMALGCSDGGGPSDDSGSIAVTVTMDGEETDPDGFDVFVDGAEAGTLAGAGTLTLRGLTAGPHEVSLEQVAPFCQGADARAADVVPGGTADVTFTLDCITGPGGRIVFVAIAPGSTTQPEQMTALDMVTGQTTLVAEDSDDTDLLRNADLSPDGSKLAYTGGTETDDNGRVWHLYIADADAPDPVAVTELPFGAHLPRWSPDGSAIVFAARRAVWDLFAIDATGANLRPVFAAEASFHRLEPDWSATGRLAYVVLEFSGVESIWTADLDGSNAAQLTHGPDAYRPTWSPDGSQLAFMAPVEGFLRIHVADADGGNPHVLTNLVGSDELTPFWSPDGEWVAFVADDNRAGDPVTRLMAVRRTGGPVLLLNDDYLDFVVWPTGWAAGE